MNVLRHSRGLAFVMRSLALRLQAAFAWHMLNVPLHDRLFELDISLVYTIFKCQIESPLRTYWKQVSFPMSRSVYSRTQWTMSIRISSCWNSKMSRTLDHGGP